MAFLQSIPHSNLPVACSKGNRWLGLEVQETDAKIPCETRTMKLAKFLKSILPLNLVVRLILNAFPLFLLNTTSHQFR